MSGKREKAIRHTIEQARAKAVDAVLTEVDRQLHLGEYVPDNFGDCERLTPWGRTEVGKAVEEALQATEVAGYGRAMAALELNWNERDTS